jgi:hypothetical protein
MQCKNCGCELATERAELGYDYCTERACVEACLKGLNVIAVHVNKASDQYVLREQLDLPAHHSTPTVDPGWAPLFTRVPRNQKSRRHRKTTVEAINELEATLDAALANESDPQRRRKLVNDYNARLRRFDIRYRRTRQRRVDEPSP